MMVCTAGCLAWCFADVAGADMVLMAYTDDYC